MTTWVVSHLNKRLSFVGLIVVLLFIGTASAQSKQWELRVCADPSSLPFSSQAETGFENRIAEILAEELGAKLTYDWHYFNDDLINLELRGGKCDMVMGVPDNYKSLLTTIAYYQSPYVFIYRADSGLNITSLDDPILKKLKIGVESYGIPPQSALVQRGLGKNIVAAYGSNNGSPDHLAQIVDAVAQGKIDVGLSWGPEAGYYVHKQGLNLKVVPVTPEFEPSILPMVVPMTIGVRQGDTALRDLLGVALANRWADIQKVLSEYNVPTEPLPTPRASQEQPAGTPLRIGVVIPTKTGSSAVPGVSLYDLVGQAAQRGGQLAAEALAAQADKDNINLKVLSAVSPNAGAALRAGERLISAGKVNALIGGIGQGQAEVLSKLAEERGIPFLNIGSPSDALRRACRTYTFDVAASSAMYLDALTAWFTQQGHHRWFIVYENTEDGTELYHQGLEALEKYQADKAAGSAAVAVGQPDYGQAFDAIRRSGADAVLLLLNAPDQIAFLAQQESVGPKVAVATFPGPVTQTRDFLGAARVRAADMGLGYRVALWETTLKDNGADALNKRFISRWGSPMDPSAWAAYAAVKILYGAVAATGSVQGATLVHYLESPRAAFDIDKGVKLSFRAWNHQLRQPLYVIQINAAAKLDVALEDQLSLADLASELPKVSSPENASAQLDQLGISEADSRCHLGN